MVIDHWNERQQEIIAAIQPQFLFCDVTDLPRRRRTPAPGDEARHFRSRGTACGPGPGRAWRRFHRDLRRRPNAPGACASDECALMSAVDYDVVVIGVGHPWCGRGPSRPRPRATSYVLIERRAALASRQPPAARANSSHGGLLAISTTARFGLVRESLRERESPPARCAHRPLVRPVPFHIPRLRATAAAPPWDDPRRTQSLCHCSAVFRTMRASTLCSRVAALGQSARRRRLPVALISRVSLPRNAQTDDTQLTQAVMPLGRRNSAPSCAARELPVGQAQR